MNGFDCDICGSRFFLAGDAWRDGVCGDCLATAIEFSLLSQAGLARRKPARRAPLQVQEEAAIAARQQNFGDDGPALAGAA